jgi:hypothetical protein
MHRAGARHGGRRYWDARDRQPDDSSRAGVLRGSVTNFIALGDHVACPADFAIVLGLLDQLSR